MLLSSRQQVVFDCCFGNSIGQGKGLKGREGKVVGRNWVQCRSMGLLQSGREIQELGKGQGNGQEKREN